MGEHRLGGLENKALSDSKIYQLLPCSFLDEFSFLGKLTGAEVNCTHGLDLIYILYLMSFSEMPLTGQSLIFWTETQNAENLLTKMEHSEIKAIHMNNPSLFGCLQCTFMHFFFT